MLRIGCPDRDPTLRGRGPHPAARRKRAPAVSLTTGRTKLYKSFQTLEAHWQATGDVWQDVARKQFETDQWAPLGPAVASAVRAVDRLAVMLQQMKSDCE